MVEPRVTLIDTHAHLASSRFKDDLAEVLLRAEEDGVHQILAIATSLQDSLEVVEIAERHPRVFASVGIHPNETSKAGDGDWPAIQSLAKHPRVVAIGETGLDRYWDVSPFEVQQDSFERHLDLARILAKPVVIHSRDCQIDVIRQLERQPHPVLGVQHSYTGTWEEAQALLEMGLHISFAGMITFENKSLDALREVAARIPLDRILVETDSPFLTPHPFRGKRNEPARVGLTAKVIAATRGMELSDFAAATTDNARRLFGLPAL